MTPHSLGYLVLTSPDLDEWHRFAEGVLGVSAERRDGDLLLRTDDAVFRVCIQPGESTWLVAVGWTYASEQEWSRAVADVRAAGVDVIDESATLSAHRGSVAVASFNDPAGYRHELSWGRLMKVSTPFRPPSPVSAFVDGIGHVVVFSDQAQASRDLVTEVLGLRLTDYRSGAWFLRCNHRHHSLAVVQSPVTRVHHFMLEVAELDDVGRARDRAARAGVLSRELGRHSNDHMVSCYLQCPGGIEIEYGWGGRHIGDDWVAHEIDAGDIWGHQLVERPGSAGGSS